ncbi:MAG: T9SS type A sorting domain-containing protein [Chitinophagaceae bacterium]
MRTIRYPIVKIIFLVFILILNLSSSAQSYIFDWGSSVTPGWVNGNSTGTATNIGGSGVNCTVSMAISGAGVFTAAYPRVNNNNANATLLEVQSASDAMVIRQNLVNRTSNSITTLTFSKPIQNVQFGISDIDYPGGGANYRYIDLITVTGSGASGTIIPVLTKYNPASAIFTIIGNVARGNEGAGGGNASSLNQGSPSQDGTVFVDFGTNAVSVITIQCGVPNIATVNANPSAQDFAIGNLTFLPVSGLPISFNSFGARVKNKQVELSWQTAALSNSGIMLVEKSADGIQWQIVNGIAPVTITSKTIYSATDKEPFNGISYYRLKEATNAGELYYSRIVRIKLEEETGIKLRTYPNPFKEQFNIELIWPQQESIIIRLYNGSGQLIKSQKQSVLKGFQVIPFTQLNLNGKGNYFLKVESLDQHYKISRPISTQ